MKMSVLFAILATLTVLMLFATSSLMGASLF